MDTSQNHVQQKKWNTEEYALFDFIYIKFQKMKTNLQCQKTDQWSHRAGGEEGGKLQRGRNARLEVIKMFCILTVVVLSWDTVVKTHQVVHFECTQSILHKYT